MNIENIYLAFRKRLRLLFSGRYFVVRKKGIRYLLDVYGYIDRRIEAYDIYEQDQLTYFVEKIVQINPSLFIDAGANLGLYSMNVACRISGIKVISHELPLLKGARRLLTDNQCFIQIGSFSPDGVFEFLNDLGYTLQKQFGNDYFFDCRQVDRRQL